MYRESGFYRKNLFTCRIRVCLIIFSRSLLFSNSLTHSICLTIFGAHLSYDNYFSCFASDAVTRTIKTKLSFEYLSLQLSPNNDLQTPSWFQVCSTLYLFHKTRNCHCVNNFLASYT